MTMDNNKYLIIITLIDGQNFTVPNGAPEKIEATVFAEARFGNESVLRSDPIKLTNSNPEFITELAWQLDRKSLHQLRVERKAIKLQVFMQTRERKKPSRQSTDQSSTASGNYPDETHRVELIGYTILDLRSAQQREQPKFKWFPLLNPKFRKPSYNRPEIQLAITLNCLNDETSQDASNQFSSISSLPDGENRDESLELVNSTIESNNHETDNSTDTKLFTTCLDTTNKSNSLEKDEIIDNDIIIRSKGGTFYVYDAKNPHKSSLDDCDERYELTITIPFTTGLDLLVDDNQQDLYYFSTYLFGSTFRTQEFRDLTSADPKEIIIHIQTTHPAALATYFELNSNLDIKFHKSSGQMIALSTIQLNQLCSLDLKCRSIEGILLLQSTNENEPYLFNQINPSMGVSVVLEKVDTFSSGDRSLNHKTSMNAKHFLDDDSVDQAFEISHHTHQLTVDDSSSAKDDDDIANRSTSHEVLVKDHDGPGEDDHHYCFTIDLKKFSYTPTQRLIPTLRELIIRYSYPFFGYKDTIKTDASIPINSTSSIIVSGFCEFNFATTPGPLVTALTEIPLNLEILAVDEYRRRELDNDGAERIVATCSINLAKILELNQESFDRLKEENLSNSSSVPIYALDGEEIGQLQIYLCLKDLGKPSQKFKASMENLYEHYNDVAKPSATQVESATAADMQKLDNFISETKKHFELWKEEYFDKLADEARRRDNDRFKRLYQRIEAKEMRRDQEFKRKMDELNNLEIKFKTSLACVDSLEKMLADSIDHLKAKNITLDNRLSMIETKISQLICNGEAKQIGSRHNMQSLPCFDDNFLNSKTEKSSESSIPSKEPDKLSTRRSSLRSMTTNTGLPVPSRSTSLVRRPSESSTVTRIVRRGTGSVASTVINGVNSKVRSNSGKLTLSKEIQAKLISLRKEKAELLKRGCNPSDELIQEINSLIEKLAC